MKHFLLLCYAALAAYCLAVPPTPRRVSAETATNTVARMVAYTNAQERAKEGKIMLAALRAVIADTRTNIVSTAKMSDLDIAMLYLQQMDKPAAPLAGTNDISHAIGEGIRQDIENP